MSDRSSNRNKSGAVLGALVGGLIAAPIAAFLYLFHRAFQLSFPPFELFEFIAGALPGEVITRGIDAMVSVIRAFEVEDLSRTAKQVEQLLAVGMFVVACMFLGAFAFFVAKRRPGRKGSWVARGGAGALLGALLFWGLLHDGGGWLAAVVALAGTSAWTAVLSWTCRALSRAQEAPAPGVPEPESTDRRRVVVSLGAATAVLTFAGVALSRRVGKDRNQGGSGSAGVPWSENNPLPNADAEVEPVAGTRREFTPVDEHYRIDINLVPPAIRESDWRLRFDGLVDREQAFTLDALKSLPAVHQFITLACISNPIAGGLIGTTRWTGVTLSRVLDEVGVRADATHLRISSTDGFDEVVSIEEARRDSRVMLAYEWDGLPLTAEHGFPLRIYLPDRYGMKQPKWIERIEAIPAWQPGYWVRRGWDREARMRATSVIDVVGPRAQRSTDGKWIVPVGGIAHAGTRGISRVEVGVDDGPWEPASLREPLSDRTWVLWKFEWPFQEGAHRFEVRCFEGDGTPQLTERSKPHPSGATGIHQIENA